MKGRPIMKNIKLSFFLLYALIAVSVAVSSINCAGSNEANISDQPVWGPTGYDHADFYFIPDIDCYYSVSEHEYIYKERSGWTHGATLPSRYGSYDPYNSYKVVVNEKTPYQNHDVHQVKYATYKGVKNQPVIRDSHDPKYFVIKDHPEHANWVKGQK
jgi:hypothetical protein